MRIPVIQGIIDRRILVNFRIDPEVMAAQLPAPFRPKLVRGYAIGGICLIRLKAIRPKLLPLPVGIRSENAAHRIAVEWETETQTREGVYIPRRDSNSRLNSLAGGSLFPGIHHLASFQVSERGDHYSVTMQSEDGSTEVRVAGKRGRSWPNSSIFGSCEAASEFFERGSLGYSPTKKAGRYEGLELYTRNWKVEPLEIETVQSSWFEDRTRFPSGSMQFDCALLMSNIHHEWHAQGELCCSTVRNKEVEGEPMDNRAPEFQEIQADCD